MKKTNITILREKTPEQLTAELAEVREQLRLSRFNAAGARAKDSSTPKKGRAQVARILMELATRAKETKTIANA